MKILTVVGARPQFIKAGAVSRVIRDEYSQDISEVIIHTGQHYDDNMSGIFFEQLDIPKPKYNLEISGGGHGSMTGRMLEALENVFQAEKPDWVLIYGDTNSTLAAALAAAKLHVPVAHVEAGLRSFNMRMPEEVNRILSDRISSLLFCPTPTAVKNLATEGITQGVHHVGDVMYDASIFYADRARTQSTALHDLNLPCGQFVLATCHRAENTDDPKRLMEIVTALGLISESMPVIFPVHPRTAGILKERGLASLLKSVQLSDPLPFLDMVALEQAAKIILTDSGGVQKEAFFYGVPCITMREETEWVETVEMGGNQLCGADAMKILNTFQTFHVKYNVKPIGSDGRGNVYNMPYGDGHSAKNILEIINGL